MDSVDAKQKKIISLVKALSPWTKGNDVPVLFRTKSSNLSITIQSLIRMAHVQQNFKTTNVEGSFL